MYQNCFLKNVSYLLPLYPNNITGDSDNESTVQSDYKEPIVVEDEDLEENSSVSWGRKIQPIFQKS